MKGIITPKRFQALEDAYREAVEDFAGLVAGYMLQSAAERQAQLERYLEKCDAFGITPRMPTKKASPKEEFAPVMASAPEKIQMQGASSTAQKKKKK